MKSAVIPQVRVEPDLRHDLEAVLQDGETISGFVETAVRNAVAFRYVQSRFLARGDEALARYLKTGESRSVDEVLAKLQAKLETRRGQLTR
ncbi:MAG: YlcI/YnfO family protein [Pseudomonadota bacterium]|nr:YlcI/YnfO family protein [Pseudomonadota bacterium]